MSGVMVEAALHPQMAFALPAGWELVDAGPDGWCCDNPRRGLRVIGSHGHVYPDGRRWFHLSLSRRDRAMPTFDQLPEAKRLFIGSGRKAVQVFPPDDEWYTVPGRNMPEVLHLFASLDDDPLPDFRIGGAL